MSRPSLFRVAPLLSITLMPVPFGPPGVPDLGAARFEATAFDPASDPRTGTETPMTETAEAESVLVLDRRTWPGTLPRLVQALPAPRHLVIDDRWITLADTPDRVANFRTRLEAGLDIEAPSRTVDTRLLTLDADEKAVADLLAKIRAEVDSGLDSDLADGRHPLVTGVVELPRVDLRRGSDARLDLAGENADTPTLVGTVTAAPDAEDDTVLRVDLEYARDRAIGKRTDREGVRLVDRAVRLSPGEPAVVILDPFASTSVRQLDGTLKVLPREPSRSARPMLLVLRSNPATTPAPLPEGPYRRITATRDGIGLSYFDREIAQVMGHLGAGWLERPEREREERTSVLMDMLGVRPGMVVADIGAGSGYFTRRLARLVGPDGRVYATDIQPQMLAILEQGLEAEEIRNVESVLGSVDDTGLRPGSVDLILLVDVYHEFDHPWEMTRSMRRALRPGGRIALVEYRADDPRVPIKPLHTMTAEQSRLEFEAAGLRLVEERQDGLPWQRLQLFEAVPAKAGITPPRTPASEPPAR